MKNAKIMVGLIAVILATSAVALPTSVDASKDGTKGYYGFPGNSLYGRSQNQNNFIRKYSWGNESFTSFEDLLEHIRAYLYEWRTQGMYGMNSEVEVVTKSATNIDEDSATLRGDIDINSSDYAHVWFTYGKTMGAFSKNTPTILIDEEDGDSFSQKVSGLEDDTRYYFRAVGEDEDGRRDYGKVLSFTTGDSNDNDDSDEDDPTATTLNPSDVEDTTAEIHGMVDMNDFDNGIVFFVYGDDEDSISDVDNDFDTYGDIDEDGDTLQKVKVDSDLDGEKKYSRRLTGLDEDETYYVAIGVQYEDEDGDDVIRLGATKSFTTGTDSSVDDEEPYVVTKKVSAVTEESAKVYGDVDMNDFDNGVVFFVYGEDESAVQDVEDDFNTFDDIDEDGDNLQKVKVDGDHDGEGTFYANIFGLDSDTRIYYAIGVQYEDEDGDDVIRLGSTKSFTTN